jgi:hypothetical protein
MYVGGDVPICVECWDAQQIKRNLPEAEQHICAALFQDILEVTALNNEATREFEAAVGQVPSGSAQPAVAQRIKHAFKNYQVSYQPRISGTLRSNQCCENAGRSGTASTAN